MDKKKMKFRYNKLTVGFEPKNQKSSINRMFFPNGKKYQEDDDVMFSEFDPFGSYTGVCENEFDRPIQDADDL